MSASAVRTTQSDLFLSAHREPQQFNTTLKFLDYGHEKTIHEMLMIIMILCLLC